MKKIDRRLLGVYTYFAKKESDRVELLYPQLDMRPRMVKAPGIIARAIDGPVARNAIIVGSIGYQCQQLKRYWHLPRIKNQTRIQRK